MPIAEIIAIGTELLLGEIQDTNTRYIARALRDHGIDIYRASLIGDNPSRVAEIVRESLGRANIVLTTGGLGPTIDDPAREAVALAFSTTLEYQPELWEQIQSRFKRFNREPTENNKRQAFLPKGAVAIENPVGTAPAFYFEEGGERVLISLPGVPKEMEYLLHHKVIPYLIEKFALRSTIKAFVLHTSGVGESQVDEWIGDLEKEKNPTVGLLAHPGQVDIRITAKADTEEEADEMISQMVNIIQGRLGEHIYGSNDDTLEQVVSRQLKKFNMHLAVIECGLAEKLKEKLLNIQFQEEQILVSNQPCTAENLVADLLKLKINISANLGLGISLMPGIEKQQLHIVLITPQGIKEIDRSYGGPPSLGVSWAVFSALDAVRRYFEEDF